MSNLTEALRFIEATISSSPLAPPDVVPLLPDVVQGNCRNILQNDLNLLMSRWFVEAFKPLNLSAASEYPFIYNSVRRMLEKRFPDASVVEVQEASGKLARIIRDSELAETIRRKTSFPNSIRLKLLDKSRKRCSICGFRFHSSVAQRFLGGPEPSLTYSLYDFLKQTRLSNWHYRIVIDHIQPIARGGTNDLENLQLLCGFCNSSKSDLITVFDSVLTDKSSSKEINHRKLGVVKISNWFLAIRVLTGSHCFKCGRDATKKELTISPVSLTRELNPTNILVTCYECDPIREFRYVAASS